MHILYDPEIPILCLHNRNEGYIHSAAWSKQKWTKYMEQKNDSDPWVMGNEVIPVIATVYWFEHLPGCGARGGI